MKYSPHRLRGLRLLLTWVGLLVGLTGLRPALGDEGTDFFEKKIRPVLVKYCYECHSAKHDSQEGGLRLDHREALREGGDSGPAVVPKNVEESLLYSVLLYTDDFYQMPPDNKLSERIISDIKKWIEMGAPDPRDPPKSEQASSKPPRSWEDAQQRWAFQPWLAPPAIELPDQWSTLPLDARVQQQLATHGLATAARASDETLARRGYLVLWGVPPTPEQIDEFLLDSRPDAWPRLVDRLLASPRFGERLGRHWLDVARYADSSGGGRVVMFPEAWRYRDYVIEAYNQDLPFDTFVREQLAGDLQTAHSLEERRRQLTGLGFLMLGPINYELQDKELLRMEVVDEQLDTIGRALLGLSVGCARCHDHKFDPLSTEDYYAMAGIFRSTKSLVPGNVSGYEQQTLPLPEILQQQWNQFNELKRVMEEQVARSRTAVSELDAALGMLDESLSGPAWTQDDLDAELRGQWTASQSVQPYFRDGYHHTRASADSASFQFSKLPAGEFEILLSYSAHNNRSTDVMIEALTGQGQVVVSERIDQRQSLPAGRTFASLATFVLAEEDSLQVTLSLKKTDGVMIADAVRIVRLDQASGDALETQAAAETRERRQRMLASRDQQQQELTQAEQELKAHLAAAPAAPVKVMAVRDEATPADAYVCIRGNVHNEGPRVPRGPPQLLTSSRPLDIPAGQSGRREFAEWLLDDAQNLAYRVYVNRLWHHTFGTGLVLTCDDFGSSGRPPVDPVLLDMLCREFDHQQSSAKALLRKLVLSSTFCVAAEPASPASDGPRLPGQSYPLRRLEAEAIRDSLLQMAGTLDTTMGGPAFPEQLKSEFGYAYPGSRRSVYLPVFRNTLNEVFEVFDFANPNLVSGRRSTSTLSTQALWIMNSDFVHEQAKSLAARVVSEPDCELDSERVDAVYRHVLGRSPTDRERQLSLDYLAQTDPPTVEQWGELIQALVGTIEFRYIY